MHHGKILNVLTIARDVKRTLEEHLLAWKEDNKEKGTCWLHPEEGKWKINFDVTVKNKTAQPLLQYVVTTQGTNKQGMDGKSSYKFAE